MLDGSLGTWFRDSMNEGGSLINLGELSKPATVLIEKISEATGGIFRPYQIRRVAQAEAQASKIRAVAQIEIEDIQRRALNRFLYEEANKQKNIESITRKALPAVEENARPQEIENDWLLNFYDKCRLISDEEMQVLWSKILAEEANSPGNFSKRTVNLLASFSKRDAELFNNLCSFVCHLNDFPYPLIYNTDDEIYKKAKINFVTLKHLEMIGLISFETAEGDYGQVNQPKQIVVTYFETKVNITFRKPMKNQFITGKVLFSEAGEELEQMHTATPRDGFKDYVFKQWRSFGYKILETTAE
jgi:hypothetical protein